MQNRKIYNPDTINILRTEITKFKEARKAEITLEKLLLLAKKDMVELIKLGCTAKEVVGIYKNAGIVVGVARVKQLYFPAIAKKGDSANVKRQTK